MAENLDAAPEELEPETNPTVRPASWTDDGAESALVPELKARLVRCQAVLDALRRGLYAELCVLREQCYRSSQGQEALDMEIASLLSAVMTYLQEQAGALFEDPLHYRPKVTYSTDSHRATQAMKIEISRIRQQLQLAAHATETRLRHEIATRDTHILELRDRCRQLDAASIRRRLAAMRRDVQKMRGVLAATRNTLVETWRQESAAMTQDVVVTALRAAADRQAEHDRGLRMALRLLAEGAGTAVARVHAETGLLLPEADSAWSQFHQRLGQSLSSISAREDRPVWAAELPALADALAHTVRLLEALALRIQDEVKTQADAGSDWGSKHSHRNDEHIQLLETRVEELRVLAAESETRMSTEREEREADRVRHAEEIQAIRDRAHREMEDLRVAYEKQLQLTAGRLAERLDSAWEEKMQSLSLTKEMEMRVLVDAKEQLINHLRALLKRASVAWPPTDILSSWARHAPDSVDAAAQHRAPSHSTETVIRPGGSPNRLDSIARSSLSTTIPCDRIPAGWRVRSGSHSARGGSDSRSASVGVVARPLVFAVADIGIQCTLQDSGEDPADALRLRIARLEATNARLARETNSRPQSPSSPLGPRFGQTGRPSGVTFSIPRLTRPSTSPHPAAHHSPSSRRRSPSRDAPRLSGWEDPPQHLRAQTAPTSDIVDDPLWASALTSDSPTSSTATQTDPRRHLAVPDPVWMLATPSEDADDSKLLPQTSPTPHDGIRIDPDTEAAHGTLTEFSRSQTPQRFFEGREAEHFEQATQTDALAVFDASVNTESVPPSPGFSSWDNSGIGGRFARSWTSPPDSCGFDPRNEPQPASQRTEEEHQDVWHCTACRECNFPNSDKCRRCGRVRRAPQPRKTAKGPAPVTRSISAGQSDHPWLIPEALTLPADGNSEKAVPAPVAGSVSKKGIAFTSGLSPGQLLLGKHLLRGRIPLLAPTPHASPNKPPLPTGGHYLTRIPSPANTETVL